MRTNIVIDDELLDAAMKAGPFSTKKDAVEAGLRLLARQAAYREILALRGKLRWDDAPKAAGLMVSEPRPAYGAAKAPAKRRK
ncbi:type II toxin-antitoxin system VapB family antitoxin [Ramlibacter albus]|uniref:Type II toxin-antitoxin system VapB family antitoxin n=1 Tax=Ramlibacter albus TaxID=2079448 RepID=A0A923M5P0_9BURK|nr:type II toxin-antitoxin system VapB family antitoxin [Ramlibacter albus]MBC5764415.1 type II toxin-antitoxin system VapB family antitoxin [Ramlibacter albus]